MMNSTLSVSLNGDDTNGIEKENNHNMQNLTLDENNEKRNSCSHKNDNEICNINKVNIHGNSRFASLTNKFSFALKNVAQDTSSFLKTTKRINAINHSSSETKESNSSTDQQLQDKALSSNVVLRTDLHMSESLKLNLSDWIKKCKQYEKANSILQKESSVLKRQLREEKELREHQVGELKTNLEETEMKLTVLEHHFCSLNEPSTTVEKNECSAEGEEKIDLETANRQQVNSSIISIDVSYLKDLETNFAKSSDMLEKLESEHEQLKESEDDLRMENEDLKQKLEARETTIICLEQSLKQMRESLFKPKTIRKSHTRKYSAKIPLSMIQDNRREEEKDEKDTVNPRLEEGQLMMQKMKESLDSKNAMIEKLSEKLKKKTILLQKVKNENKEIQTSKRTQSSLLFDLRTLSIMNEMMTNSVHKLESLVESKTPTQENNIIEETHNRSDSSTENLVSIASNIALFQKELQVAMKTVELSVKNKLQFIQDEMKSNHTNNGIFVSSKNDAKIEAGQKSSEESKFDTADGHLMIELEQRIKDTHDICLMTLRSIELQLSKRLDDITEKMHTYEFTVSEKQDMIESLELRCKNNDITIDKLQNELDMTNHHKSKIHFNDRREVRFPLWKTKE